MKRKIKVVVEKGPKSYGAYSPDLPGCVAVAKSAKEVLQLMREAVRLHLEDQSGGAAGAAVPRK